MSGQYSGIDTQIKEINSRTTYHTYSLNVVGISASENYP